MNLKQTTLACMAMACIAASNKESQAITITGGSAKWTINEGFSDALGWLDANFTGEKTRSQVLSEAAPGNAYYNRLSGNSGTLGTPTVPGGGNVPGTVIVTDAIRPYGVAPLNDAGGTTPGVVGVSRTRQATTLDLDPSNVLGSWSTSIDAGAFVGLTGMIGEQIAFTNMQRYGGPFTGVLVYGDFALRNTGTKLTLTSNIDFLNAAFADIGSPAINVTGNKLTITGALLVGGGLNALDPSSVVGTNFGTFEMTAYLVPEPASMLLGAVGGLGMAVGAWHGRRKRNSRANA